MSLAAALSLTAALSLELELELEFKLGLGLVLAGLLDELAPTSAAAANRHRAIKASKRAKSQSALAGFASSRKPVSELALSAVPAAAPATVSTGVRSLPLERCTAALDEVGWFAANRSASVH